MIFSRSPDNNEIPALADSALADYYSVPETQTKGWSAYGKDGLTVTLPFAVVSTHKKLERWLIQALAAKQLELDEVSFITSVKPSKTQHKRVRNIKNIIAVASGKGGVGKSTTSVNLAFALMQEGARVGILDADIYGPSVPIMLGNPTAHPQSEDNRHMIPLESHGVVANSIGYLVPAENATIWRGPMVSRALQQLVNETLWPELDYLIVDMPPGTGDIQLTLAQQVPVTAAVVVTTPQDLALADAIKGIAMFEKVDIPVLGLIENMSYYQCKKCGHREEIFASEGGAKLAKQYNVALLGQLPLDIDIRTHADGGEPILLADPKSPISDAYRYAARRLSRSLALTLPIDNDTIEFVEKH
ncbi:iron-sulfur cluster carrier protein ApbC [Aestuariibacter salexigens]|uniref:iron-sulfur cluster carrier protein ApbC n=1 Tax=Aestuariibacter salexigens TaxID=226010 RepID=UPI00042A3546|nr:iron-sulfur cluster carrier protein ApbC [Aestuariibacter salexigens]